MDWADLSQDSDKCRDLVNAVMNIRVLCCETIVWPHKLVDSRVVLSSIELLR
jgi:hypothetical protein